MKMKRAKENHPTVVKLESLFDKMAELGIRLTFTRYGRIEVIDNDHPDVVWQLMDVEWGGNTYETSPSDLPLEVEYKLVRDE